MRKFTEILAIAVGRKGSIAAVEVSIPAPLSPENLSAVPGDRWLSQMTQKRIRHLPVVEGGRLVGFVSIGDLVKFVASEQDAMIRNLEKYIEGSL